MTDRDLDRPAGDEPVRDEPGLWEPAPGASADLERFERELGVHAWSGRLPELPEFAGRAPVRASRSGWILGLAAAAALLLALLHLRPDARGASYELFVLSGAPSVDGATVADTGTLATGAAVDSGPAGGVRLAIGELGSVELGPDTLLRAVDPAGTDATHRFELERGSMHAWITARPREFQVGTPAGLAVDLGCEYTATVEPGGRTRLAVAEGVVSFEGAERRVFVPRSGVVRADPVRGPGTPHWQNAGADFRAALERVDLEGAEASEELATVLGAEGDDLSLTYWHLLLHRDVRVRRAAAARLAEVVPPPPGV